ncbi:MAG TPA: inositol monophosphatase family protein, partial [Polyangiaceae bacterium LLY-WYZ-15_(1-7)]|nr:inositol monophosphatase family protein [Polyangiaceae bacterium LLY-WYZ-15_(1-7)]
MRDLLKTTLAIAEDAATLVLAGFRDLDAVEKKGTIDLVTEYDLKAEARIRERLAAAFPDDQIVGEEGEDGAVDPARPVWYVDPIDGTTNFAHGHPFFSVSIARFAEGRAQVGVVAAPALGVVWAAAEGLGATRNGALCRVSERATLEDALCATGFPYDRWTAEDDNLREHRAFLKRTRGIRRCGSAAIDLCLVADGTYDLYWEQRLSPWDMAAGACLVAEAGGTLTDYDGGPADPRTGRLV